MRSFRSPRGLMVLVLMMVMALVLAACGSTPAAAPTAAPAPEATDVPTEATEETAPAETTPTEAPPVSTERLRLSFGGGPVGGVFQVYADTLAIIVADADPNLEITAEGTGGSAENLRSTNSGDFQFGIVYAGDVALGAAGELPQDPTQYTNVLAVAPLYGGVIHLVVSERSGIQSVADLPGKRIALGNAGSGAALSAERYFTHMGLIDQVQVEYLGYSQAASAMGDGQLDGFWILAGFPNASVTEATTITSIRLIDVYNPGVEGGFFEAYPFYSARSLVGGAYTGVDEDVPSFQDTALWVTNVDVPDDVVYNALKTVFGDEGMSRLRAAHPSASEVALENGITGIGSRLHPGAVRFWEEQGVTIPDELK
ncbi:TAXI family TRAP transporter solute-binding subunit [Candidatus Chloroploca asiatica]|uniref:C4-dicarboxylate ABC transporter substrate-binding protein n=1 Tax=Candidatus Chloroploca asiatica TaxID=1506545 RepID=A0A2H3L4T9_9CHLR|nr:TAXI family TRAP transporter solute-binding subunit [Candidatus Chloroploca asiatica]PDV99864.1 C4-dicarboxylate ABC transporter substrate-binding protein [Candidatus Chloroploca asiatica]